MSKRKRKKDRHLVQMIGITTGLLLAFLIIGIVIFSLPNTAPTNQETTDASVAQSVPDPTKEIVPPTTETEPVQTEIFTEGETIAPVSIDLVAFGDNLLHKGIMDWVRQPDGTYDLSYCYTTVREVAQTADICVVNQEVPIGGEELGLVDYPIFNAVYDVADELYRDGVNVLSLATNHTLDMGAPGVINMLNYLRANCPDMLTTGAYLNQEERNIIPIKEISGIKVAFLNYTYDLNGHSSSEVVVNLIDDGRIISDIQAANEQADFVVVCMHWGDEHQFIPNDEQKRLAQLIADAGGDLILGTHTHTLQPVKELTGVNGNKTLVYYSLGNLVSLQHFYETMLGGLAKVTITKDNSGTHITDHSMDYVVTHWGSLHDGCRMMLWKDYTPELALEHGIRSNFPETLEHAAYHTIKDFSYETMLGIIQMVSKM